MTHYRILSERHSGVPWWFLGREPAGARPPVRMPCIDPEQADKETELKPIHRKAIHRSSRPVAALVLLILASSPAGAEARGAAQEETQEQIEALGRALGMTPEEVEALGLTPDEITCWPGSPRRRSSRLPRPAADRHRRCRSTCSRPPICRGQPAGPLRTVVPSQRQHPADQRRLDRVRPAMLRNLAPDHTLVLVNGSGPPHSSIINRDPTSRIPAIALRQVEVLDRGRAVRLGAIAGVMNLLKDANRAAPSSTIGSVEAVNLANGGRHRFRQPEPGVRRLGPSERTPERRHRPHRGRQHRRGVRRSGARTSTTTNLPPPRACRSTATPTASG